MPASPRRALVVNQRRQKVADLYLRGWTQSQIAEQMGLKQPTISRDLSIIQDHWRNSSVRDFDTLREIELRKLDRLEREAWAAWERSQKPAQAAIVSTAGDQQKTQKTVKEQIGDPRYLEQVAKCIASRRTLLGLDAPMRIAPTSPDGTQPYHAHVMSELMRLAEQSHGGPVVVDAEFIRQRIAASDVREPDQLTVEQQSGAE